ncbi:hypothetical protein ACKFKG_12570 [Phormidesmis sp. 146-35]
MVLGQRREEGGERREEGRGKREEGRGKREEGGGRKEWFPSVSKVVDISHFVLMD